MQAYSDKVQTLRCRGPSMIRDPPSPPLTHAPAHPRTCRLKAMTVPSRAQLTSQAGCSHDAQAVVPLCWRSTCSAVPLPTSHSRTVPSLEQVASVRSSGDRAPYRTQLVWPTKR